MNIEDVPRGIYDSGEGVALDSRMADMCGPKLGVRKMTLMVTLGDIKRDPYSDINVKFDTLTLTFRYSFLMGTTLEKRRRQRIF